VKIEKERFYTGRKRNKLSEYGKFYEIVIGFQNFRLVNTRIPRERFI